MLKTISLTLFIFLEALASGQETFYVKKTAFSSDKYDQFSPVYYKGGLVYCSNQMSSLVQNYSTLQNKGLLKISYVDSIESGWGKPILFSDDLSSRLNDGPVTFNRTYDTIYFSRNLIVDGNIKSTSAARNKLGIFYAVSDGKNWTNITELRFNNDSYNITTPYLSPDGKRLYFASDKPEGYGGSDLYYCTWNETYWSNPVNLGPVINTPGNEAFPFINQSGELFFSSDSHPGLGGKDIFFSKHTSNGWVEPVRLDAPVNSKSDDFGFISKDMDEGFFSSDRGGSVDIYSFKTINPQFLYCESQKENFFCFNFPDDISIDIDPVNLQFQWDFGDGNTETGFVVEHCFPGPGKYLVKQDIVEKKTGRVVFNKLSYELEIAEIIQPYIAGDDIVISGDSVAFTASKSNLPGFEKILYKWDFGDGTIEYGENINHTWKQAGEYLIKLGIVARDVNTNKNQQICVSKVINVTSGTPVANTNDTTIAELVLPSIGDYDHAIIKKIYSASDDIAEKGIFQVEVLSSGSSVSMSGSPFMKLTPKYRIKEIFHTDEKLYSYVIDEAISFMDLYNTFSDAHSSGFRNARIRTYIPSDVAEKELWNLKRIYDTSSDVFFTNRSSIIQPGEYPVLDHLVILLKKFPEVNIEVVVHSDNTGTSASNLLLSDRRAQSIVSYIVSKGINRDRLRANGAGDSRPVTSNYSEAERKRNRRVDFVLLAN